MSSEIVAGEDGISESGSYAGGIAEDSNGEMYSDNDPGDASGWIRAPPGLGITEEVGALELLGLRNSWNPSVRVDLVAANHHMKNFIHPEKGHKYVTHSNPTPNSVKPILDGMKEPSVLLLRGCDHLLLPPADFPFTRFNTLTALEISGVTHLTTLPENSFSEMTQLLSLHLSHLPIRQLPNDLFSVLTNLRSLAIRHCPGLLFLPNFPDSMEALECLDLSHLLIETVPDGFYGIISSLGWLTLRGCCNLHCCLPITKNLEVLDLSHSAVEELVSSDCSDSKLKMLDLSCTSISCPPFLYGPNLTHLFLRDAKLTELKVTTVRGVHVLDLSGAQNVRDLDVLKESDQLVALDLSRTGIESIGFISGLVRLQYLILRQCTRLLSLPAMNRLMQLKVLDLSCCEMLCDLPEDLCNLGNLKELNLSGCSRLRELREGLFQEMSGLEKLDLSKTHPALILDDNRISKHSEFHLFSTFYNNSMVDRFKQGFAALVGLISNIQENFNTASADTTTAITDGNAASGDIINTKILSKRQFRGMLADLEYIRHNIDLLESSHNCTSAEEHLKYLMNASDHLSAFDFQPNSTNLSELIRTVVKLKLIVPSNQRDTLENGEVQRKNKMKKFIMRINDADAFVGPNESLNDIDMEELRLGYESLTDIQRNCLLYYTIFPSNNPVHIKERILIQLWYGEGLIDTQHEENPTTIEEIGRKMLNVLSEKGFIKENVGQYESSKFWDMDYFVHLFIKERAKEHGLFDIVHKNGTPRFWLLQSHDLKIRAKYNSSTKLESFNTIRTLFNVNQTIFYIRPDWFSKMKNLSVMHIGRWDYDQDCNNQEAILGARDPKRDDGLVIEVGRSVLEVMKVLRNKKQLRLLSMEGFSTMRRLPDSICELTNLKILNLRDCSYFEKLPARIASLKNLTHLDLTNCPILCMFPKGIRWLSKLEVLKGFVITHQVGGQQHRDACTLEHLSKLEKLRNLTLVVDKEEFPEGKDLKVFKEMKSLSKLKITWGTDYNKDHKPTQVTGQEVVRHPKRKQLKCWEQKRQPQNDTNESFENKHLDKLNKLVLRCFPLETAPSWLQPSELQNLEKLYIVGGKLKTLIGDNNQDIWNVKTLKLRHLKNLDMDWKQLRHIFSNMTYFRK